MESSKDFGKKEGRVIQVNEGELKKHVSEIVRESVEETLNGLLEAEADQLCQARRYERNAERASKHTETSGGRHHRCKKERHPLRTSTQTASGRISDGAQTLVGWKNDAGGCRKDMRDGGILIPVQSGCGTEIQINFNEKVYFSAQSVSYYSM